MRATTFWIGVILGLLGIALPVVGVPTWLAWSMIGACGVILVGLGVSGAVTRHRLATRSATEDESVLPMRNDGRDLADDLEAYANRLADWLDARDVESPSIIEANKNALAEALRISQQDPERWEAHQEASAHYDRVTRTDYVLGWRSDALALFDQAMAAHVITPKIRERFEKPDMIQLRALPDVLRKLAERLRVQAADKLLSELTIGHFPSPMRPRRNDRAA